VGVARRQRKKSVNESHGRGHERVVERDDYKRHSNTARNSLADISELASLDLKTNMLEVQRKVLDNDLALEAQA
jgi:hypothetical protein